MTTLLRNTLAPLAIAVSLLSAARLDAEEFVLAETALDIKVEKAGHLFFEGDEVRVAVTIGAGDDAKPELSLKCSLTDLWQKSVSVQTLELKLGATRTAKLELSFGTLPRGYYDINATVLDGENALHSARSSLGVVRPASEIAPKDSPLGVCLYYHEELEAAARTGIKWVRLDFPWPHSEWKPDTFVWHVYDPWVRLARAHGMAIHAVLLQTPAWASSAPKEVPPESKFTPKSLASYRNHSWTYPPRDLADWKHFVATIVGRYKKVIKHWEMWNEADFIFWWGTYEQYVELLKVGYRTAKQVDPSCQVILAGPAWIHGLRVTDRVFDSPTWLKTCLKDEGKNHLDILNFHSYGTVPYLLSKVKQVRSIASAEKCDKPLWCTETGRNSGGTRDGELRQCEYLVKACVGLLAAGVPRMYWWEARDDPIQFYPTSGLFRADYSPKPSAVAANALLSAIEGARFVRKSEMGNGVEQYLFSREDSSTVILWSNGPPADHTLFLGSDQPVRLIDITGNERLLKPEGRRLALPVTSLPVFLQGIPVGSLGAPTAVAFEKPLLNVYAGRATRIPVTVINPFDEPKEGLLRLVVPRNWGLKPEDAGFELEPGDRRLLEFVVSPPIGAVPSFRPIHAATEFSSEADRGLRSTVVARVLSPLAMSLEPQTGPLVPGATITVKLRNQTRRVAFGKVAARSPADLTLEQNEMDYGPVRPFGTGEVTFTVKEVRSRPKAGGRRLFLTATGEAGKTVAKRELSLDFAVCKRSGTGVTVDGHLREWGPAYPVHLSRFEQLSRTPSPWHWAGPEDLKARILTMWDEDNFYLAGQITDNVISLSEPSSDIWMGDTLQFALDTGNERGQWQDNNDYEFVTGLTENGPLSWVWYAPEGQPRGELRDIKLAIQRPKQGGLTYEMAIPWSVLKPLQPKSGTVIGFSALCSDNDGFGKRGWIGWYGGIGERKSPKDYGTLTFIE